MPTQISMEDLKRALREGSGVDESIDLDLKVETMTFEELGYDSLAILETGLRLGREHGVEIADDDLADVERPQELVSAINRALAMV
ncbi:MAG TPA: acyl carrier protein [Jatrophihabitans sp.]|uniref:acyl carrier protein n=1 Tax=Jatrophihabitans sp. TaxID=1932789 RepID=UPI002EFCA4D3